MIIILSQLIDVFTRPAIEESSALDFNVNDTTIPMINAQNNKNNMKTPQIIQQRLLLKVLIKASENRNLRNI